MLLIDPQNAGISGDMFIAALLELGSDFKKVEAALNSIKDSLGDFEIQASKVVKSGILATRYEFGFEKREIPYTKAKEIIDEAEISKDAKGFASKCLDTLVGAEAKVHGMEKEDLKLHDAWDSVADFIASAVCLEDLNLLNTKVISTPANTGKGFFKFHGKRLPLPSPPVVEILKGKPLHGDVDFELTTPTGASILVNLVDEFVHDLPFLKIEKVGYGAGSQDLNIPNVLRVMLCEEVGQGLMAEDISVLQTNLDNVSGEILGHTLEKLMDEGAKDVVIMPCTMKKNRPGNVLEVICAREDEKRLAEVIMFETGSLGVRTLPITHRYILKREIVEKDVEIGGINFRIRFKVAYGPSGNLVKAAPEFNDVKRISKETRMSAVKVRELLDAFADRSIA
ncbi:MAG: nickel pincer cofactor biosynthesis protein LarC [Candidatus Zixiibacteriota bacterium]